LDIDAVPVNSDESYPFAGVYGFGRGLFKRDSLKGSDTTYSHLHRLHEGQLVMSQPEGWEGAITVVPKEFEGRFLSKVFPTFSAHKDYICPEFLNLVTKCKWLWDTLFEKSNGIGARRNSIYPAQLLEVEIALPPLAEQQRIVAYLDAIEARLARVQKLREEQEQQLLAALRSAFHRIESESEWIELGEIAPLQRRQIEIEPDGKYPGLGARSFGKGIFHKPTLTGSELTWQKLFRVHANDIVFSNIKAWEGAIAVAGEADDGRFGSHRYLTCVADSKRVLPEFVCFYLLTRDGLEKIGRASPGSADRNRTLSVKKLEQIRVPVPSLECQHEFKKLLDLRAAFHREAESTNEHISALLPSLLDRVFNDHNEDHVP
ncbi:MAG: restriction endonuclease subunit S, partial [Kiritimatiellae bacterium]|nr:restriction endonuclease subunit S [Kiritimatiellia bacterium]